MGQPRSTCWTLIEGAAAGRQTERDGFVRRYAPAVETYLGARWRHSALRQEIQDAVQDVFLECFRRGGALERTERDRPGGFRAFLYGVIRNVALRHETRAVRARERAPVAGLDLDRIEHREEALSKVFDRAWAKALLREAWAQLEETARAGGGQSLKRVELLRLRFRDNVTVREIAQRWNVEEKALYREFDRAKQEYRAALEAVVAANHPGSDREVTRECQELLGLVRQG